MAYICKKLDVTFTCEAYNTDVRVWAPQLEFGVDAMPPCVSCKCAAQVRVHGWSKDDGHVGHRVCGMQRHYFMLTLRYICTGCTHYFRARVTQYVDKYLLSVLQHPPLPNAPRRPQRLL